MLEFKSVQLFVKLRGGDGLPSFVCAFLPIVPKHGLKEAAHVHLLDKVDDFIVFYDAYAMVATFDMAAVELAGKGADVGVGSVAPWSVEVCLDGESFAVCDDKPCPELAEQGFYCLVVVADVIFFELVDILLVDGGDGGLNFHGVDNHLKMVLRPAEFVVLLQLDKVPAFGVVRDVGLDKERIFEPGAVEALVSGDEAHFSWSRTSGR